MIISFLGDSITEGVGATSRENRFSSILCRKVGAVEENYGLSGTRIARQRVHYGEEKVCFILPSPRYSQDFPNNNGVKTRGNYPTLEGYREVMRDVLSSYRFDTLELKALPDHPKQGPSEFYKVGLHPNDKGHEAIVEELYRYLQKKGLAH